MNKRNRILRRAAPFASGVMIGLSVVTPVFAATSDLEALQPVVLIGSLVVLAGALILKAVANRRGPSSRAERREVEVTQQRDLRWQSSGTGYDIPLPHTSMR
jgi:hypothetical protein